MENKNQEERVVIWSRKYRRKLGGNAAPFRRNLAAYLKKHPDCEVYAGQDLYKEPLSTVRPILPKEQSSTYSHVGMESFGPSSLSFTTQGDGQWVNRPSLEEKRPLGNTEQQGLGYSFRPPPPPPFSAPIQEQKIDRRVSNRWESFWTEDYLESSKSVGAYETRCRTNSDSADSKEERKQVGMEQIVESSDSSARHISHVSAEEDNVHPTLRNLCEVAVHPSFQTKLSTVSPDFSSLGGSSFTFSDSFHTPYSIASSGSSYSLKERWAYLRSEAAKNEDKNFEGTQEEEMNGSLPDSVPTPSRFMEYEYYSSNREYR